LLISQRTSENNLPIRQLLSTIEKEVIQTQIGKAIALVVADLGLKTMPDALAQKRMIHYLLSYYKDFSFGDIVKAFELALVGKLQVNIEHYDSFDIKYLTRILNTYRKYRRENTRNLNRTKQIEVHQPTQAEQRSSRIEFFLELEKTYENYRKTGNLIIPIPWFVYNKMLNYNVIQINENDWNHYLEQAVRLHKNRLHNPKSLNQRNQFKTILQSFDKMKFNYPFELSRIRNITKEIALKDFFEKLKNSKTDFSEILSKSDIYE
jgi:hypothetical protein